jgi:hypothetical protein
MKRFIVGFVVGVGLMYWYLHYGDALEANTRRWFEGAASNYRDDKQHDAAREVFDGERRP